ncbi:hypothetical protein PIB30_003746 [Stylosanthes scabra]|uniref:Uncharacterized protein n=1 Tax=Stylosanthes scabra TaxID=79078 RepID=A0ABU6R3V7_9FABA|nr:hypothetical protein [Stylosanthes scabra]
MDGNLACLTDSTCLALNGMGLFNSWMGLGNTSLVRFRFGLNPTKTNTFEDDRRTDDVLREMELGSGPTNENQGESKMEGAVNMDGPIVEETMGSDSEVESDSLSAPPGFEPTYIISPSGLAEWEQIKETQSVVERGRSVPTRKQRRKGKSRARTSLKLRDRIQAGLKGASKRKKGKKHKEISDIADTVWEGHDYVSGESDEDDIENSDLEPERIWRIGEEIGLVAKEAGTANRYLRNKEEEEAKQRRGRETKKNKGQEEDCK